MDTGQWERHFNGHYSKLLTPQFTPSTSNFVASKGFMDRNCPCIQPHCTEKDWVPEETECFNNGVFQGIRTVSSKQITDGASHTFLLGERDSFCLAATWIGIRNPVGPNMWASAWALGRVSIKLNHPVTGDHNTCTEGFSSKHPGGAYFAFSDASVHFVSDDVNYDDAGNVRTNNGDPKSSKTFKPVSDNGTPIGVYQRLGVRNDQLSFSSGDY